MPGERAELRVAAHGSVSHQHHARNRATRNTRSLLAQPASGGTTAGLSAPVPRVHDAAAGALCDGSTLGFVDDHVLMIETSWPATTIDGEPGIVFGTLSVSRAVGGEFLLNLSVGPPGGAPENFTYLEFPLSSDH